MATGTPRELIVPLFIPHAGCPHHCIFCNQHAVTGQGCLASPAMPPLAAMEAEIERWLSWSARRHPVEISFYGGTFLGLPVEVMTACLELAHRYVKAGRVHGIRFSTRPDTVTESVLALLAAYPVTTVELGAQSMEDAVLVASTRGHRAAETATAMARLQEHGYRTILQAMVGLPGETRELWDTSLDRMLALSPYGIRIYPTVVLSGSGLEALWRDGLYTPLSLDEAVRRSKEAWMAATQKGIKVIRMGLQESEEMRLSRICAGPHHPAFGHLVHSARFLDMAESLAETAFSPGASPVFRVHPRSISRLRGQKNSNLVHLKKRYALAGVRVAADEALAETALAADGWVVDSVRQIFAKDGES
ncbi:radical SAM protein [Desulfoluna limicola]|uniref:Radical SAM protein n=1 Tax=Desulfoluna limicola TaxID=2810562 RepID=A0ABN6F7G6_9BACT|nr:radical SAM protein [Desulfoluna limicola]BCS98277.1 radical SAM protein [Desulfoluna limicola]